jgi:hypothetical protein
VVILGTGSRWKTPCRDAGESQRKAGATEYDIHAIKQAMEKGPQRTLKFPMRMLQFTLLMQRQIARN